MTLEKSSSLGMKTWQLGRSVTSGVLEVSLVACFIFLVLFGISDGCMPRCRTLIAFERRERGRRELVDMELDFSRDRLAEEACAILVATVPALRICFVQPNPLAPLSPVIVPCLAAFSDSDIYYTSVSLSVKEREQYGKLAPKYNS